MSNGILPEGRSTTVNTPFRSNSGPVDRPRRKDFVHEIFMAQFIGQQVVLYVNGSESKITGTLIGLDKFAVVIRVVGVESSEDCVIFKHAIDEIRAETKNQHGRH